MKDTEDRLQAGVDELLRRAEETDEREDREYGKNKRGDELPEEVQHREGRLKKIREAMAALEAEAKEKAANPPPPPRGPAPPRASPPTR